MKSAATARITTSKRLVTNLISPYVQISPWSPESAWTARDRYVPLGWAPTALPVSWFASVASTAALKRQELAKGEVLWVPCANAFPANARESAKSTKATTTAFDELESVFAFIMLFLINNNYTSNYTPIIPLTIVGIKLAKNATTNPIIAYMKKSRALDLLSGLWPAITNRKAA